MCLGEINDHYKSRNVIVPTFIKLPIDLYSNNNQESRLSLHMSFCDASNQLLKKTNNLDSNLKKFDYALTSDIQCYNKAQ